jgi:hypothetical protein
MIAEMAIYQKSLTLSSIITVEVLKATLHLRDLTCQVLLPVVPYLSGSRGARLSHSFCLLLGQEARLPWRVNTIFCLPVYVCVLGAEGRGLGSRSLFLGNLILVLP